MASRFCEALKMQMKQSLMGIKRSSAFHSAYNSETIVGINRNVQDEARRALGICADSGYTIKASTLDRRIKTVATVWRY